MAAGGMHRGTEHVEDRANLTRAALAVVLAFYIIYIMRSYDLRALDPSPRSPCQQWHWGSKEAPGWLHVLLVEDEILQATMLRVLLLDRGLLVVHAQNLR